MTQDTAEICVCAYKYTHKTALKGMLGMHTHARHINTEPQHKYTHTYTHHSHVLYML